jgi:hypothetical protein
MSKQQVIDKVNKGWIEFKDSIACMSENELLEPGKDGGWSVKDMIVHVRTWEEETLKHLPTILKKQKVPRYKDLYGGIDAFNAMTHDANKTISLRSAVANLEDTHRRLISYLESVPEDQFKSDTRFYRRLAADTYKHYPEHIQTIGDISKNVKK